MRTLKVKESGQIHNQTRNVPLLCPLKGALENGGSHCNADCAWYRTEAVTESGRVRGAFCGDKYMGDLIV